MRLRSFLSRLDGSSETPEIRYEWTVGMTALKHSIAYKIIQVRFSSDQSYHPWWRLGEKHSSLAGGSSLWPPHLHFSCGHSRLAECQHRSAHHEQADSRERSFSSTRWISDRFSTFPNTLLASAWSDFFIAAIMTVFVVILFFLCTTLSTSIRLLTIFTDNTTETLLWLVRLTVGVILNLCSPGGRVELAHECECSSHSDSLLHLHERIQVSYRLRDCG